MSYKETSSVSDLFPLDTLRLITGCTELRLKFVEVFAQEELYRCWGRGRLLSVRSWHRRLRDVSQWTSVYLGTLAMRGHSAICTRATNL